MSIRRLEGKTAVVTGGAMGLGKAIAARLGSEGAQVVITDRQAEAGHQVADELGVTYLEQDVRDEKQWAHIVSEIERRFGRLDILINNAGIFGSAECASPENTPLASWQAIFAVNVEGVFLGCRTAIPAMRRAGGGSIVNVSSMVDHMASFGCTAYGASKAAVRHLTMSVAQYCAQKKLNVRCNSVHPGVVRTPLFDKINAEVAAQRGVPVAQVVAETKASIPLGDFTQAEDVAAGVAFLVSEDARHITGSTLLVDGGFVHCRTSGNDDV